MTKVMMTTMIMMMGLTKVMMIMMMGLTKVMMIMMKGLTKVNEENKAKY